MQTIWLCSGLFFISLLVACSDNDAIDISLSDSASPANTEETKPVPQVYTFGFDPRSSPQEDARQYLPFLKYLEQSTGHKFTLRFTHKDADIVDDIGTGVLDFAAIGATSYIHAREVHNYPITPIARGLNMQGEAEYRSFFVVHPRSEITSLTQLKAHSFAFGSETSTQGHLIPRIVMLQHGISLSQLSRYEYTGSHIKCANAVVSGRADVCGMQDTMADNMARQGLLKILFRSAYYPSSGIVANEAVDKRVIKKVQQALIAFRPMGKHSASLYHWQKTEMPRGFVKAMDQDYQELKKWMRKLGFLQSKAES